MKRRGSSELEGKTRREEISKKDFDSFFAPPVDTRTAALDLWVFPKWTVGEGMSDVS